jgi:CDP-Glycerol:Poly(glycerophosphate) glycerophosphotransferase
MSAIGSAAAIVLEKARARRLARRLASEQPGKTPVAIYFADPPANLYQLRRWLAPLAAVDAVYRVVLVTSDSSTYRLLRAETTLEVAFATGTPQIARALTQRDVRVILYPNHNALNFRVLRFAHPVHVFIGHGESAKESSVSRQLKAYDLNFVADPASLEQLRTIRGYDADAAAVVVGSPWLDFLPDAPASWRPDGRQVVLYAPTWEGDRPSMQYGSVESHGDAIVGGILADPALRLIYRPHPWLGRVRASAADADSRIRAAIRTANRSDVVDTGEYGWSLRAADICVTDISSVASDARELRKPLLVTEPTSETIPPVQSAAYRDGVRVTVADAGEITRLFEAARAAASPGTPKSPALAAALIAGIGAALGMADSSTL